MRTHIIYCINVTAEVMVKYYKDTGHRFNNLRRDSVKLTDLTLQMDNARPHSATLTQDYLTKRDVPIIPQSPYSPDLNLCDRFLFKKMKRELKPQSFRGPKNVEKAVQHFLRALSSRALAPGSC